MQSDPKATIPNNFIVILPHGYLIHIDERMFRFIQNGSLIGPVTIDDVCKAPKEKLESKTVCRITTISWLPLQAGPS